ncbi:MAG: trimeric intracellular cation channel family protein [Bacteroidetes bacterium]|nr:trimeric intracellular cation channel family protein [Bacteroidota bacterium]
MHLNFIDIIEIIGTFSFAVSGAFAAMEKNLDPFGILIIAFATAIGGGTIRDLLIGSFPVAWLKNSNAAWAIFGGAISSLFFGRHLKLIHKLLFLFDALGLGLFTVIGLEKGLAFHLSNPVCVALGTITGCFGGVLRDVMLNNVPLIFHKEFYASASILGASGYFLLVSLNISEDVAGISAMMSIVVIRLLAVRYNWTLPKFYV